MATTPNMSLTAWTDPSDSFSHDELAANWTAVDTHDHTSGKGVAIPAGGLAPASVITGSIADAAITNNKLADFAVGPTKVGAQSVGTTNLQLLSVTPDIVGTFTAVRVYSSTNVSVGSSATPSAITFDSIRFDTDSIFTPSATSVTVQRTGVYVITGGIEWQGNNVGLRTTQLTKGSTVIATSTNNAPSASVERQNVSSVYRLVANDNIALKVAQTSGGALNVQATGNYSPELSLLWVGHG